MAERKPLELRPPTGVIPSKGIVSEYVQNGLPPDETPATHFTNGQKEILSFKHALATYQFKKFAGPPTYYDVNQKYTVPDAGTWPFGQTSGYGLIKSQLGFDVQSLPENLRKKLPPEEKVTIHTSKYRSDEVAFYVQYKPDGGKPAEWFVIQKKADDPGYQAKKAERLVINKADIPKPPKPPVTTMMMDMVGGIFAKYGAALPPPDATPQYVMEFHKRLLSQDVKDTKNKRNKLTVLNTMALDLATFIFGGGPKGTPLNIFEKASMIYEGLKAEAQRVQKYPSDEAVAKTIETRLNASFIDKNAGPTKLSNPRFLTEFERIAGPVSNDSSATLLGVNKNAESLTERVKLINDATDTLDIAVWKIYGDESGKTFVDALLAKRKANPDMPITVTVDGNVANRAAQYLNSDDPKKAESKKSAQLLQALEKAGIEVVRWFDPNNPLNGMHYKGIVADANTDHPKAIVGGRNVGDWYMGKDQWSDIDVLWDGKVARTVHQQIAEITNYSLNLTNPIRKQKGLPEQALIPSLSAAEMEKPVTIKNPDAKAFSIVDIPGPQNPQDVAAAMVKAFDAAEHTLDIQQGYFLQVPAVTEAVKRAIQRGVKVRIITNGEESNDVEMLNLFTKVALSELLALGKPNLEIYTPKSGKDANGVPTNTLHAKAFVVDNKFCGVGSWNQHPRSMILEAEGMIMAMDEALSRQLTEDFEAESKEAKKEDAQSMQVSQQEIDFAKRLHFIIGSQT